MKKRLNKLIVMLLIALFITSAPLTAFAEPSPVETEQSDVAVQPGSIAQPEMPAQTDSSQYSMETALIAAKSLLKIDDDVYSDFSYSSMFSNYETREGLVWTFSWSDSNNGYIYALVGEDGTLLQYSKYSYRENSFGFAEISKTAATAIAEDFIKKAKPDGYMYYKTPADVYISIHNSDYRLNYYADMDGYLLKIAYVTVNVNKFTGEITGYSTSNIDPNNYDYEDASVIISEDEAVEAYVEKIGLSLEYRSYLNYEDGSIKVFPVYIFNSSSDRYIGAVTGDIVQYVYDLGQDDRTMYGSAASYDMAAPEAASLAGSSGGGASLTPAEIAAINQVSNYLTGEQALAKLLEAMDITDVDLNAFNDRYINLSRDYVNRDKYSYDISFYRNYGDFELRDDSIMSLSGRVDAQSGKVINFYMNYYGIPSSEKPALAEEQAVQSIEAFLKKIAPEEYAKSEMEEIVSSDVSPYSYRGEYYVNYYRYENGIAFRNNGINVSLNLQTGKITRYSLNWYDNISFPGINNVMSPLAALAAYIAGNGSSISYITIGDGKAGLVYEIADGAYIDPFSGNALDYSGEPRDDDSVTPDYSDVNGHWSEAVVKRLLDNGVYSWGGSFEPDKVMTELEFLEYLLLLEQYYYYAVPTEFFIDRGIDIAADPDRELTRQEAVRIIVEYLGYGKLAKQSEWFLYPFSDNVDAGYKGYITVCYMLGIIGGANGSFNAAGKITRAQAAVILQNIIVLKGS